MAEYQHCTEVQAILKEPFLSKQTMERNSINVCLDLVQGNVSL
jgi:hypothetical protein